MSTANLQNNIVATYHVNIDNDPSTVEFIAIVDGGKKGHSVYEVNKNGKIKDDSRPLDLHTDVDINFDGKPEGDDLRIDRDGMLFAHQEHNQNVADPSMPATIRYGADTIPTDCECGYDLNKDGTKDYVETKRQPVKNTQGGDYVPYITTIHITPTWTPMNAYTGNLDTP